MGLMLFNQRAIYCAPICVRNLIRKLALKHLPLKYKGYPVRIYARDVRDPGVRMRQRPNDPGLEPRIEIYTIHDFFKRELGVDPIKPLSAAD